MSNEIEFKVGDIVEAFGCRGVVVKLDKNFDYSVEVFFDDYQGSIDFLGSGQLFRWHKEPSLKLISRKKTKKKFWLWLDKDSGLVLSHVRDEEGKRVGDRVSGYSSKEWSGFVKIPGTEVEIESST